MRLEYQIVGDDSQLKRCFRSIETEAKASQRRQTVFEREGAKARVATERSAGKATVANARVAERAKAAAARAEQREVERINRYWEQQKARHHAADLRRIDRKKNAEIQAAKAAAREAERSAAKQARANDALSKKGARWRDSAAGKITAGAGRVASRLAAGGAAAAALGTGLAVNAVYNRVGVDQSLRTVANQGFSPSDGRSREQLYGQAKDITDRLANTTGASPEALTGAIGTIMAKTGNFDTAIGSLEELNNLALATGSSIEDLGATYGGAVSSLKRGGATTEEAIKQALELSRVFAGQAKFGEIETSDLATQGGKLIGSAAMFAGDRTKNLADMGALAQMAAQGGATSAEDAATSVKNFGSDAIAKADKLGVNVWSDSSKTKMRGADEIMADAMKASGGNLEKLLTVFGAQSRALLVPNLDKFNEAGGGEAGRKAVLQNFADFRGQVLGQDEVNQSAGFAIESPGAKFAAEMNKLNQKLGDELLPKLPPLIDQMGRLTPYLTDLATAAANAADWLAENPFTGMGIIVGGLITKEIASAAIGSLITKGITSALAAAGIGTAAASAAGGGAAAAGTAGAAAAGGGLLAGGKAFLGRAGGAIARGGAAAAGALGTAGTAVGGALTAVGAKVAAGGALATGALGAAAVGSTALAGYQGYKLNNEVSQEGQGGFLANLMKVIQDGQRNQAEADKMQAEREARFNETARRLNEAAEKLKNSAPATVAENRYTPMGPR